MPFIIPSQIKKQRSAVQSRPLKQYSVRETQVLTKEEQRKIKALKQKVFIEKKQHDLLYEYLAQAEKIYQAVELEGACIVSMVDAENELISVVRNLQLPAPSEEPIEIKVLPQTSKPILARLENEMVLVQRRYSELQAMEAELSARIRARVEEKCKAQTFFK